MGVDVDMHTHRAVSQNSQRSHHCKTVMLLLASGVCQICELVSRLASQTLHCLRGEFVFAQAELRYSSSKVK
jgi:hypothetical protein